MATVVRDTGPEPVLVLANGEPPTRDYYGQWMLPQTWFAESVHVHSPLYLPLTERQKVPVRFRYAFDQGTGYP